MPTIISELLFSLRQDSQEHPAHAPDFYPSKRQLDNWSKDFHKKKQKSDVDRIASELQNLSTLLEASELSKEDKKAKLDDQKRLQAEMKERKKAMDSVVSESESSEAEGESL